MTKIYSRILATSALLLATQGCEARGMGDVVPSGKYPTRKVALAKEYRKLLKSKSSAEKVKAELKKAEEQIELFKKNGVSGLAADCRADRYVFLSEKLKELEANAQAAPVPATGSDHGSRPASPASSDTSDGSRGSANNSKPASEAGSGDEGTTVYDEVESVYDPELNVEAVLMREKKLKAKAETQQTGTKKPKSSKGKKKPTTKRSKTTKKKLSSQRTTASKENRDSALRAHQESAADFFPGSTGQGKKMVPRAHTADEEVSGRRSSTRARVDRLEKHRKQTRAIHEAVEPLAYTGSMRKTDEQHRAAQYAAESAVLERERFNGDKARRVVRFGNGGEGVELKSGEVHVTKADSATKKTAKAAPSAPRARKVKKEVNAAKKEVNTQHSSARLATIRAASKAASEAERERELEVMRLHRQKVAQQERDNSSSALAREEALNARAAAAERKLESACSLEMNTPPRSAKHTSTSRPTFRHNEMARKLQQAAPSGAPIARPRTGTPVRGYKLRGSECAHEGQHRGRVHQSENTHSRIFG